MTRAPIPSIATYRGVELHDQQDEARLAVVRGDVDAVFETAGDLPALVRWAGDRSRAPEARLLASALALAEYEQAIDERRERPRLDRERLAATTAGLGTTRSPIYYDSLFSPVGFVGHPGEPGVPVRRASPLI